MTDGLLLISPLFKDPELALRIYHGFSPSTPQELKGVSIDKYANTILIQTNQSSDLDPNIKDELLKAIPNEYHVLYKKKDVVDGKFVFENQCLRGGLGNISTTVIENNLKYHVNLLDHLDGGLYLDNAETRNWLLHNAKNKKVLNLYSYTCSLGVSAMIGGAFDVINVDSSKRNLQIGKENYALNGLSINPRSFQCNRVNDFLRYERKKKNLYDLIIIDPSPPSTTRGEIDFKLRFYSDKVKMVLPNLNKGGVLVFSCHNFLDFDEKQLLNHCTQLMPELKHIGNIPYPEAYRLNWPKMILLEK